MSYPVTATLTLKIDLPRGMIRVNTVTSWQEDGRVTGSGNWNGVYFQGTPFPGFNLWGGR
ncbi:MAG TPA: hypothetical protein PLY40_06945 [Bacillota bacterium]|nr:hypothetical protein [Bacillota bacterium]